MSRFEIKDFWDNRVGIRVKQGWDPPLAFMTLILRELKSKHLTVSNQDLRNLGDRVVLFPGVQNLFSRLREFINQSKFREANVSIEFYIISGGLEEILKGTSIAHEIEEHRIFGCTFHETEKGGLIWPKRIITFTEKTKFLYAINKGVYAELARKPFFLHHPGLSSSSSPSITS